MVCGRLVAWVVMREAKTGDRGSKLFEPPIKSCVEQDHDFGRFGGKAGSISSIAPPTMSALSRRTGAAALARASFASTSRSAVARRTLVTIPAPELENPNGMTEFAVRTFDRMPNMTYAFAIVRAIEAKYGVVLNLEVPKDADTLRPGNRLFVRLLKPIELSANDDHAMEIPAPKFNPTASAGGVTLAEIEASLRPSVPLSSLPEPGRDEAPVRTIKFTLEPRRGRTKDYRYLKYNNRTSAREEREDDEIVRALQSFSGGFFDGLTGVADKFKNMVIEQPEDTQTALAAQEAAETLAAEIAQEEAELERQLAEQRAARAAALDAAAAQAVAAEEQVTAEFEAASNAVEPATAADAKAARLERLKARAMDAARVKAAMEREAADAAKREASAAAAALRQAERAEPALAGLEARPKSPPPPPSSEKMSEPATKSAWRWFERK